LLKWPFFRVLDQKCAAGCRELNFGIFFLLSAESTSSPNFGEVRGGWVENFTSVFSFVALKIALDKHPMRLNIRRGFLNSRLISEAV
jgi:hypothetical protein